MNNIIYEYVPSENIAKVDINDFETLLEIKDSYEKLIRKVPNNVLQQRIDKAIEYIEENEFYYDYKTGACVKGVIPLLNILRGEDNERI